MSQTTVKDKPTTATGEKKRLEDMYQVILHNDDRNIAEHVVDCLVRVFGHSLDLAVKIMLEAHNTGQAIAEVEGETEAKLHRDQLESYSLNATVEKI